MSTGEAAVSMAAQWRPRAARAIGNRRVSTRRSSTLEQLHPFGGARAARRRASRLAKSTRRSSKIDAELPTSLRRLRPPRAHRRLRPRGQAGGSDAMRRSPPCPSTRRRTPTPRRASTAAAPRAIATTAGRRPKYKREREAGRRPASRVHGGGRRRRGGPHGWNDQGPATKYKRKGCCAELNTDRFEDPKAVETDNWVGGFYMEVWVDGWDVDKTVTIDFHTDEIEFPKHACQFGLVRGSAACATAR